MAQKIILVIFSLFFLLNFYLPAFAETEPIQQKSSAFEILTMIDNDLDKNYEAIVNKSSGLSESEKIMIFSQKKKEPGFPFILNLILGFGIGSFVTGDSGGGVAELIGELVGAVLVASGPVLGRELGWEYAIAGLGWLTLLAFRLYGLTQPFSYSSAYNSKLQKALSGNSLSFEPYFKGSEIGVSMIF